MGGLAEEVLDPIAGGDLEPAEAGVHFIDLFWLDQVGVHSQMAASCSR